MIAIGMFSTEPNCTARSHPNDKNNFTKACNFVMEQFVSWNKLLTPMPRPAPLSKSDFSGSISMGFTWEPPFLGPVTLSPLRSRVGILHTDLILGSNSDLLYRQGFISTLNTFLLFAYQYFKTNLDPKSLFKIT